MAKCAGCGKLVTTMTRGAITCSSCPLWYHKGCVSLPETIVVKDWTCPVCKAKLRKGDNSGTPIKGLSDGSEQKTDLPPHIDHALTKETLPVDSIPSGHDDQLIEKMASQELLAALNSLTQEIRGLRAEMFELRTAVTGLEGRVSGFEQRLLALERREAVVVPTPDSRVVELEGMVTTLQMELAEQEQEALLSDLEIGHLPEEKGENVIHAVAVLASRLGVVLEERDVLFAERVGKPPSIGGRPRRLVVRLARRQLREEFLRAARVRRTLSASDQHPQQRVFVNERLTRQNRQLLHRAREVCRGRQWRYVWIKRGHILIKQAEGKPAYRIKSNADLEELVGTELVATATVKASTNF